MQGNESKIAFISLHFLFRIGTFQRVMGDKSKKISSVPSSRGRLCATALLGLPPPHAGPPKASPPRKGLGREEPDCRAAPRVKARLQERPPAPERRQSERQ